MPSMRMARPSMGGGGSATASGTSFDNTGTDLQSTDVEGAIKEVNDKTGIEDISDKIVPLVFNASYSGKTMVVQKMGKLVCVDFNQQLSQSLASSEVVLATGFPLPKDYVYIMGSNGNMNGQTARFCINKNGELCSSWNDASLVTAGAYAQAHFLYFTKE